MVFINNLVPLSILYCHEGILLGLSLYSVPSELKEKGVEINTFKFSYLILLPYLFRYILAPLIDSISLQRFGRRRSQLTILYAILGVLLYFSNFQTLNQSTLFWNLFLIFCVQALIDLIIAARLVESLDKEDRGYGAIAQFLGILIGGFIGAYIFSMFNSLDFCNTYIYTNPQEIPVITLQIAFQDLSYLSFGLAVACCFIIYNENANNQDIIETYKAAFNAFSNRYLIILFLFFCFFRIGQMPIDLAHLHMKRSSFTEGQIQFLEILAFPIACALPYYMTKMIKTNILEIRLIVVFSIYEIIISGVFIICLFANEEGLIFPYRDLLLKISLISVWLLNLINITLAYSYIYKNTKSSISATFIALLTTGITFQFIFEGFIEYLLVNYNYYLIWLCGIGIYALFFYQIAARTTKIDQMDSSEFCLEIDVKKERFLISTELTTLS
ncbi:unnamed protein product [Paramecium pentaurelia]|uniref:Acetyl-coenzyme A transporter 1 n=1 Tax=Paramecium pentaurelia TaxID=43138 RepID=A0A8S1S9J6_9CILI|nr:unnamed protein product [Paramecium pentaurelia]